MSMIIRGASALALLFTLASFALADETAGTITKIDVENAVIMLDDGNKYVIPEEFYVEDLEPGMMIRVLFDVIDGNKMISDLEVEG